MSKSFLRDERPSLYCIELRTDQWEASVEWYRHVLGLRVLVRVTDDGYALLDLGETRLAILSRTAPGDATRRISLAFEVADVEVIAGRLRKLSTEFTAVHKSDEGTREINVLDPDGNRLRLFSWPRGR